MYRNPAIPDKYFLTVDEKVTFPKLSSNGGHRNTFILKIPDVTGSPILSFDIAKLSLPDIFYFNVYTTCTYYTSNFSATSTITHNVNI